MNMFHHSLYRDYNSKKMYLNKTRSVAKNVNLKQEQKLLQTSAPRVNFMFSKQKFKNIHLKRHKNFRNSLK